MEISLPFEGVVPEKYSKNGQDISPPVEFSQVPEETQSIALIVEDPDAPGPGKFTHWIIWDIPPEADLPEGLPNKRTLDTPEGAVQGRNGFGDIGYGGPKPPAGTHTYVFKAYALDTELDLEPGASKQEFQSAIKGKIIGKAKFSAEYTAG